MKVPVVVAVLNTDKPVKEDASKLRGYMGNRFPDEILLHHHMEGKLLYTYPRVQYKIIEGTPLIVGVMEGAKVVKKITDDIEEIVMDKNVYKVRGIQINQINDDFKKTRKNIKYKFITPWLALNQDNYERYRSINDWKERKKMLNNILVGNIFSICKSFGYEVIGKLYSHSLLHHNIVKYKAIPHTGFTGEFKINFFLPDYIGIGKGVSHGFGTIKKVREYDRKKT